MRRMDLDHPNAEADELVHVSLNVRCMPWMYATARNQPPRILFAVIGDPLVHFSGETHAFRRNIINEDGALDPDRMQTLAQRLAVVAVLDYVGKAAPRPI